jgi:2-methylcitrate dehydratase PrpD
MSVNGKTAAGTEVPGATAVLAAYAAGLRYEDIPPPVIDKIKACVLDTLGCMLFGATLPWTRIVADVVREEGGAPQASLVGSRGRVTVSQAVFVNSTAGHAFELDDAHTRASMHAGSIAVATALAIAEWRAGVSGRDFVTAIVAGYETGLRIGMAGAGNIFKRGFHSSAVCGGFVAAATAARLLGLDAARTQHAFGITGSMASGLMAAQEGAMVKRLHSGQAARNGVTAVLLAQRGFTGITNVLEAPFGGFFSAMTERHQADALVAGLGTQWETLALGFKPYATAGAIHPALALLDAIMTEHRLTADDIAQIHVECTTHCKNHVAWPYVPQGVASAQMNIFYALSVMALDRAAMVGQFDESRLEDPAIIGFMRRITVTTDAAFDAMGNAFRYATRVIVSTPRGDRHAQETLHRPGSPDSPLSGAQIAGKFEQLAARVLDADACRRIQAAVQRLDSLPGLEPLIAELRVRGAATV